MSTPGVRTASTTAVDPEEPGSELLPAVLLGDRYVMIERVGEGGMGQVWRAFDVKLERSVALKFVHEAAKSSRAQTRIVREARAMARLAHPNVLSVFDVVESEGMTGIVMELVTGCTLRDWMKTEHSLREILAVFAAAARGLHAAHEAGFVHRDFKPANVLLADPQSAPAYARVRVMDFGLAREDSTGGQAPELVAGARVVASEALTAVGEVMGTPAYMAPEQRAGAVVDARCDQYSFCVSLHEAVLGTRPARAEDPTAGLDDPRLPSWLRKLLRVGLQLDPGKRHPSMAVIAATLEARAEGRRITQLVTAAVAALAIATVVWTVQSRGVTEAARARCAEDGAAIHAVWGDEQRRAVELSLSAVDVVYAGELFRRVAPWLDRWADEWASTRERVCVADTVEGASTVPAAAAIDCLDERRTELAALVDQLAHADAGVAESAVSDAAGLPALAPCLDQSMLALRPALPDDPTQRQSAMQLRDELAQVAVSHSIARADDLVAHARKLGDPPLLARALVVRGHLGFETEDAAAVEAVLDEAFRTARRARLDLVAAEAAIDLVFVTGRRRSAFDEGILWGELATALLERSAGEDDPRWSSLHTNLGLVLLARGDHDDALVHMQRAVAITERTLGSAHPWLSTPLNNLGLALSARGDEHGAIIQYERAIAITEVNLGLDHPEVAMTLHNLGDAYLDLDQPGEGRSYNERALAIWQRTLEPDHPNIAMAFNSLAHAHFAAGDRDAAIADLERALQIWRTRLGPDDPAVGSGLNNLAVVYTQNGQREQAERYYVEALALRERVLDPLHVDIARTLANFAKFRFDDGRVDEAATMAARAVQIFERSGAGDPKELARALRLTADCARARGDTADAEARLARAQEIERRSPSALSGG